MVIYNNSILTTRRDNIPTAKQSRQYILSDGSSWNATELGEHLNLTSTAARYRLNQTSDAEVVLRERHINTVRKKKVYKCKTFKLSDDTVLNAEQISKRFKINTSTIYARLLRGITDIDVLSKKPLPSNKPSPKSVETHSKSVRADILTRNAYDPMSKLFLKMS